MSEASKAWKSVSVAIVIMLVAVAFQPYVSANFNGLPDMDDDSRGPEEIPGPFRNLRQLVIDLIDQTPGPQKTLDQDGDGLPDNVEWVIGTDFTRPDSDFDKIKDYQEAINNMDPNEPDSNFDGLGDYYEITNVDADFDGDGIPNVWDWDNDNDGVYDGMDISPYVNTDVKSTFEIDVATSGNPLYMNLQVRTENPDNMRLYHQHWNWPHDEEGTMKDVDDSIDDVRVTPILEFVSDTLPSGPMMDEYGLSVHGDTMYIPVFPVWEYGNVVAFKAKVFYPGTGTPQQIRGNLSLSWKVKGLSDSESRALGYISGGLKYAYIDNYDKVVVDSPNLDESSTFFWVESKENVGGFQSDDGRCLAIDESDVLAPSTEPMYDGGYFTVVESTSGDVLLAENGKYLRVQTDHTVKADADASDVPNLLTVINSGVKAKSTTLAYYYEDFAITGAIFEEHTGTDVGVLFGENVTHSLAANLELSLNFLRNTTNDVNDIQGLLDKNEIPLEKNISRFSHRDIATQAMMVEMINEYKDRIPEGEMLPVIQVMQSRSKSMVLADVDGANRALGQIKVDLDQAVEEVTKTMKTVWYKVEKELPIPIEYVIQDLKEKADTIITGVEETSQHVVAAIVTAWNVGETFITRIGDDFPDNLKFPNDEDIGMKIGDLMKKGLEVIKHIATIIKVGKTAYEWLKVNKLANLILEPLSSIKSISKTYTAVGKLNTGVFKIINKLSDAIDVIGLVIDVGIALYCMFAIADSMDWSATGIYIGVLYGTMMIIYAVVLFAIGLIPYVGWLISLLISLSDMICGWIFGKGWSQMLMELIIDLFTDFNQLTEADIKMNGSDVDIDDKDGNGVDVGDRITFKSYVTGRINRTSDGSWRDVMDSYILPSYDISVPAVSNSKTGTYRDEVTVRNDPYRNYRETDYEVGAWFEPGIPMVNFPMTVSFKTDMRVYHEECFWAVVWWCDRKTDDCSTASDPSTLYFDVMPATISDFAQWRGIVSNDHDGDRINNTDEKLNRCDEWNWDTDGDGLGDNYELEIGTFPYLADSDDDGLDDKTEHLWGTDPQHRDSDRDGLSDYIEHNGWVVNFDYFGKIFDWHINSNPMFNDTDGDMVDDYMEYRTLQNPMSADTNGDGIKDETKDYFETYFHHKRNLAEGPRPRALAVDSAGNLFVATYNAGSTSPNCFVIYDKQGNGGSTPYDSWGANKLSHIEDMAVGPDDKLYLADYYDGILRFRRSGAYDNWRITESGFFRPTCIAFDGDGNIWAGESNTGSHKIWKFAPDGSLLDSWGGYGPTTDGLFNGPTGIAIHPDGYVIVADETNRVQKFHPNGTHIATWRETSYATFSNVEDVDVDSHGDVFISDYGRHFIQKVDEDGRWIKTLGQQGDTNGRFNYPYETLVTDDDYIYVCDHSNFRVQLFWQKIIFVPATPLTLFTDTDGDGFEDKDEANEWTVTVVNASGTISFNVSSSLMAPDTDNDGLNDLMEFQLKSDPTTPDTDGDGVPDAEELGLGTNVTHWDSDNDGLQDAIEITFESSPVLKDTDNDGLLDKLEWDFGSNPKAKDTDLDGLDDLEEALLHSDLINADSDGDYMFDGQEVDEMTSPNDPDMDGDGLNDGYELLFHTDPLDGDSDGDNLLDAFEIGMRTSPINNDTDGDTLLDSTELDIGMNPRSRDSDGDGVPDQLDLDYTLELQQKVYLAADPSATRSSFIDQLGDMVDMDVVDAGTLLKDYKTARYIVLVGDPATEDEGNVGSIVRGLLEDTPDLLERMQTSDEFHITVRYGVWVPTQTIVMISRPYPSDHIRVAGILKSMQMTVSEGAVAVSYLNPRSCFLMEDADTVKQTDTVVWTKLDEMATFSVSISKYSEEDAPFKLDTTNGLEPGDEVMGKYVTVDVSESIQSNLTDMVSGSSLRLYYTVEDLDMTGDGDDDDDDDLNEETLCLYRYDEETETWVKVLEDLPWVTEVGVNTTDVEMFGQSYAGFIYAEISHFSNFGAGGRPNTFLPTLANAGEDIDGLTHQIITFNGTSSEGNGELNYTWTFYHRAQPVTLYGPTPTFVFTHPGQYVVTLMIKDEYNVVDGDTVFVTIISLAEEMFDLMVGPMLDIHGEPIADANVRVSITEFQFFGMTDEDGYAEVEMPMAFQGREVEVFVVKSGHAPLKFMTNVTMEGALDPAPPVFYREMVEVLAHAGIDRVAYLDEETMLDGTLSRGNGGIAEYTWTFDHKGSKRTLTGATPTFVFEEEGDYEVTLEVTDYRGFTAETTVTLTVIQRPAEDFTLYVGPVMDQHNLPIVGAKVELTIGDDIYYGNTLADGVAYILLPGDARGQEVEIYVQGTTFQSVSYTTTISEDGELERAVPQVESETDWKQPGEGEGGGFPAWLIGVIVAVVVVLLLVFLIVTKRIGGRKEEDEVEDTVDADIEAMLEEIPQSEGDLEDMDLEVELPVGATEEAPDVEAVPSEVAPEPEVEPEEEELHVVTPPTVGVEEEAPKVDFKDLPRAGGRPRTHTPAPPTVEEKELNSVDADAEVTDAGESTDTEI